MVKIKLITSSKGGSGKTALASALMLAALRHDKPVLLVDLNVNNLDFSRILCSSSFFIPDDGSFFVQALSDELFLLSKQEGTFPYLVIRSSIYSPIKTSNLWPFIEELVGHLKKRLPAELFQNLEVIVDTSFNVTSLFPFSMIRQQSDRTRFHQSRDLILGLQSELTTVIARMITNLDVKIEIFIIVDSLRVKSYLISEKLNVDPDSVPPMEEFNELRYYYRLERKLIDELGQQITYVFSPRPIIPEKGIVSVIQEALRELLGKKADKPYYPLMDEKDMALLNEIQSRIPSHSSLFRVKNLEGFLTSLDIDDKIQDFVQKPRWGIFLEIEREIFQHLADMLLHKSGSSFPRNVLFVPAFVYSMVNWSELILSHGKIIDEKDFELSLGYFLEMVERWYNWRDF